MRSIVAGELVTQSDSAAVAQAALFTDYLRIRELRRKPIPGKVLGTVPIPPESVVNISLEQAIEIHAKALCYRHGTNASERARERASQLSRAGDDEGNHVWLKVAAVAETLGAKAKKVTGGSTS